MDHQHAKAAEKASPADYVRLRLDQAGATLMAMPSRGCFPARCRSSMPDYLEIQEDGRRPYNPYLSAGDVARELRAPPPSRAAITAMDEVYLTWIPLMPSRTEMDVLRRKIVLLRSLVWPRSEWSDPHVWRWKALGERFGRHPETIQAWHATAIDRLVAALHHHKIPLG